MDSKNDIMRARYYPGFQVFIRYAEAYPASPSTLLADRKVFQLSKISVVDSPYANNAKIRLQGFTLVRTYLRGWTYAYIETAAKST